MTVPDDLTADLPAPREDEPESLRRDIVDELTDHLHCSLQRELLASGGRQPADSFNPDTFEQTAWQSVLNRFGNPAAIARRLWFDAMKEKLMAQKLTATMATLAAAAGILICVLLWQSTLRDAGVQQKLLAQQQELNRTLLAELKAMQQTSSSSAANAGWVPVQVNLQSEAGTPVAGRVGIQGTAINAGNDNKVNVSRTADAAGIADFGMLPFGNYEMEIVATDLGVEHNKSIMLSLNTPAEMTIVCPTEFPPEVDVSFAIDVPPLLHADRLVFAAYFQRSGLETSSGSWYLEDRSERSFSILFDAEGQVLGEVIDRQSIVGTGRSSPYVSGPSLLGSVYGHVGGRTAEKVVECHLGPARPVREGDHCVGIGVVARLPDDTGDKSVLRLFFAPNTYMAEVVGTNYFEDADPAAEHMQINFTLPASVWTEVVSAFRQNMDAADVTIPDGWQIVQVPTDIRNLLGGATGLQRLARGGSQGLGGSSGPELPDNLRVMVSLQQVQNPGTGLPDPLPLGVGTAMQFNSEELRNYFSNRRSSERGLIDTSLLVNPELAEAIARARKLGTLEAVRIPAEEADTADDTGVNQQTLEILQKLETDNPE